MVTRELHYYTCEICAEEVLIDSRIMHRLRCKGPKPEVVMLPCESCSAMIPLGMYEEHARTHQRNIVSQRIERMSSLELSDSESPRLEAPPMLGGKESSIGIDIQLPRSIGEFSQYPFQSTPSTEHKRCSVCLTDYQVGEKVIALTCFHVYHLNCISTWVQSNNSCPICKSKVIHK